MSSYLQARAETVKYHTRYYQSHSLFEKGSWLESADQKSLSVIKQLPLESELRILDLGCGVGRNAIPIAQLIQGRGRVICVDFLELAIERLVENSLRYMVSDTIHPMRLEIEQFFIEEQSYDLIIGISVFEHLKSWSEIISILQSIVKGTKPGGFNRLEFTTQRQVFDTHTGEILETLVETQLDAPTLTSTLEQLYSQWKIHELQSIDYNEETTRENRDILWCSKHINFIAENS